MPDLFQQAGSEQIESTTGLNLREFEEQGFAAFLIYPDAFISASIEPILTALYRSDYFGIGYCLVRFNRAAIEVWRLFERRPVSDRVIAFRNIVETIGPSLYLLVWRPGSRTALIDLNSLKREESGSPGIRQHARAENWLLKRCHSPETVSQMAREIGILGSIGVNTDKLFEGVGELINHNDPKAFAQKRHEHVSVSISEVRQAFESVFGTSDLQLTEAIKRVETSLESKRHSPDAQRLSRLLKALEAKGTVSMDCLCRALWDAQIPLRNWDVLALLSETEDAAKIHQEKSNERG
jgi:hypothetical protein